MDEPTIEDIAGLAQRDQEITDARHSAECVVRFYSELVQGGICEDLLDELTKTWFDWFLTFPTGVVSMTEIEEEED